MEPHPKDTELSPLQCAFFHTLDCRIVTVLVVVCCDVSLDEIETIL